MCGIAAQYGEVDLSAGKRMLQRIEHRGPDGKGSVVVGEAWLGKRRLSTTSTDGTRPLSNPAGTYWSVADGTICCADYPTAQAVRGSRSAPSTDNGHALILIDLRGPGALERMHGTFAVLAAGTDGRFVAARDPIGAKPLYWAERDGKFRFSSEMRAFDPDWRPYVAPFPPGHYWTPESGLVRFGTVEPPWGDSEKPTVSSDLVDRPPHRLLDLLREVLVSAVGKAVSSEEPVGVLLSGGLNSSLVAAVAARHIRRAGRRLQTFAVGTPGSPDLAAARVVAEYLGADHHERVYTAEAALRIVPKVVRAVESFDTDVVRSSVANYLLAELAARHVKIVLIGDGADEAFGGHEALRDLDGEESLLRAEFVRIMEKLHRTDLQRSDRVASAHGLEAKAPFVDRDVVALGFSIPARAKLAGEGQIEKHLLRAAFAGWLPHNILWRKGVPFQEGSGVASVLEEGVEGSFSGIELERERAECDHKGIDLHLRTREEASYYRTFRRCLEGVRVDRVDPRDQEAFGPAAEPSRERWGGR